MKKVRKFQIVKKKIRKKKGESVEIPVFMKVCGILKMYHTKTDIISGGYLFKKLWLNF
jgi:hypothetical protein